MSVEGSEKLPRDREERYCQILAQSARNGQQMTLVAAWCESADGHVKPTPSPGLRVSASKAMSRPRVQSRLAYLKAKNAAHQPANAGAVSADKVTSQSIANLMNDTSEALLNAAKAAKAHGANNIARQLMKGLTVHVGRVARVIGRVETPTIEADADEVAAMASRILQTFEYCTCRH